MTNITLILKLKRNIYFQTNNSLVAWIDGIVNNMCQAWPDAFATISSAQDPKPVPNPCGNHFALDNGHTYYLAYCGTSDLQLFNGDGSFNSHCHSEEQELCTGTLWQTYKCY